MDTLAKTLGVDIYVYESYVNKDGKRVYMSDQGEKRRPTDYMIRRTGASILT